jgi:hypothetical protein
VKSVSDEGEIEPPNRWAVGSIKQIVDFGDLHGDFIKFSSKLAINQCQRSFPIIVIFDDLALLLVVNRHK